MISLFVFCSLPLVFAILQYILIFLWGFECCFFLGSVLFCAKF